MSLTPSPRGRKAQSCLYVALLALLLLPASLAAQDRGISLLAPETHFDEGFELYTSVAFATFDDLMTEGDSANNPLDIHASRAQFALGLTYGFGETPLPWLTNELAISLHLPYTSTSFNDRAQGTLVDDTASGVGDITLMLRKRFIHQERNGWDGVGVDFSLAAGLTFPSGSVSEDSGIFRIERAYQPGTGSYSATLAAFLAVEYGRFAYYSTTIAEMRSFDASYHDFGDVLSTEFKVAYMPEATIDPTSSWTPSLGVRFSVVGGDTVNDLAAANTGYRLFEAIPGIIWRAYPFTQQRGFGLDLNLQLEIPVMENVTGTQLGHSGALLFRAEMKF